MQALSRPGRSFLRGHLAIFGVGISCNNSFPSQSFWFESEMWLMLIDPLTFNIFRSFCQLVSRTNPTIWHWLVPGLRHEAAVSGTRQALQANASLPRQRYSWSILTYQSFDVLNSWTTSVKIKSSTYEVATYIWIPANIPRFWLVPWIHGIPFR